MKRIKKRWNLRKVMGYIFIVAKLFIENYIFYIICEIILGKIWNVHFGVLIISRSLWTFFHILKVLSGGIWLLLFIMQKFMPLIFVMCRHAWRVLLIELFWILFNCKWRTCLQITINYLALNYKNDSEVWNHFGLIKCGFLKASIVLAKVKWKELILLFETILLWNLWQNKLVKFYFCFANLIDSVNDIIGQLFYGFQPSFIGLLPIILVSLLNLVPCEFLNVNIFCVVQRTE